MRTKKKYPKYEIQSPKYRPLYWLYDNLAFQDSSFQSNQIILEFFDDHVRKCELNSKEFIRELSSRFRISAGTENFDRIKEMMAESYIVQTYNIAEFFFKDFNRTFRKIKKKIDWKTSVKIGKTDKKLDPLNQLVYNLPKSKSKELISLPEYLVCNYYRLLLVMR